MTHSINLMTTTWRQAPSRRRHPTVVAGSRRVLGHRRFGALCSEPPRARDGAKSRTTLRGASSRRACSRPRTVGSSPEGSDSSPREDGFRLTRFAPSAPAITTCHDEGTCSVGQS